jgi:hypothetical protein
MQPAGQHARNYCVRYYLGKIHRALPYMMVWPDARRYASRAEPGGKAKVCRARRPGWYKTKLRSDSDMLINHLQGLCIVWYRSCCQYTTALLFGRPTARDGHLSNDGDPVLRSKTWMSQFIFTGSFEALQSHLSYFSTIAISNGFTYLYRKPSNQADKV